MVREISGYIQSPQSDGFWVTEKREEIEEVLNIMDSGDVARLLSTDRQSIVGDVEVIFVEVQYLCSVAPEHRGKPEESEEDLRLESRLEGRFSTLNRSLMQLENTRA